MAIVGPQGPAGGGVTLFYTADRLTSNVAPAQAKNWLIPWGLTVFPATALATAGIRIYVPFAGTIKHLRAARFATADDITFGVEVNGTEHLSLLLANGAGAASITDNVSTFAVVLGDYITISATAATPDTANFVFPQLVFTIE